MDFHVERSVNRISIQGGVQRHHLRRLCASLHQTIVDRGFSDVVLDFSTCDFLTEAVMLPLMPIITDYRRRRISFDLIPPADAQLNRLFLNANWGHYIRPERYDPSSREGGHVPALRFGGTEDQSEILDKVMRLILRQLETDRSTLKAIEWSLWEIMDNVSNHAQSPVGGFVQATAYKNRNQVEFVVSDAGIGIPASMQIDNHATALSEAINEGVTRDKTQNAGNGLYGSYRVAVLSGGQFEIHSLHGLLYVNNPDEGIRNSQETVPYNGTSVRCAITIGDHELLNKALRFKNVPHDPPFDYIERTFERGQGDVTFNMRDQAWRDFGSRQGGVKIRGMIQNLLNLNHPVILDFNGVGVISSSFADEVFGRLFVEMGPRAFMTRIEMRNVDPTVEGLIDRAIVQRTRIGNGDT